MYNNSGSKVDSQQCQTEKPIVPLRLFPLPFKSAFKLCWYFSSSFKDHLFQKQNNTTFKNLPATLGLSRREQLASRDFLFVCLFVCWLFRQNFSFHTSRSIVRILGKLYPLPVSSIVDKNGLILHCVSY